MYACVRLLSQGFAALRAGMSQVAFLLLPVLNVVIAGAPIGVPVAQTRNQQGTGRLGLDLCSFDFGCSLSHPASCQPQVQRRRPKRSAPLSKLQRDIARFEPSIPPSSRASRSFKRELNLAAANGSARPAEIPRRSDLAGGPARPSPLSKLSARLSPCRVWRGDDSMRLFWRAVT